MLASRANVFVEAIEYRWNRFFLGVEDIGLTDFILVATAIENLGGSIAKAVKIDVTTDRAAFLCLVDDQLCPGDIDLANALGEQQQVLLFRVVFAISA